MSNASKFTLSPKLGWGICGYMNVSPIPRQPVSPSPTPQVLLPPPHPSHSRSSSTYTNPENCPCRLISSTTQSCDMSPPIESETRLNKDGFSYPEKVKTDVLMSIKEEHINNIASGRKNHEYRKYLLPDSVQYLWFYTVAPVSSIQYIAKIGPGRKPGEVPEDGGIGNEDFNAGRKVSKFGYEIKRLYRLHEPLTLIYALSKGYLNEEPQRHTWTPTSVVDAYPVEEQECIITRREANVEEELVKEGIPAKRSRELAHLNRSQNFLN